MSRFVLALLLAFLTPLAAAPTWTVQELFETLARQRPERATFQEKKYLALLDRPAESSGVLRFTPPARLEKRTTAPRAESVVADGDVVTLERNGKRYAMSLSEQPAVGVLIESIRATLAGDLGALTRAYAVALEGTPAAWRLLLRPLDNAVSPLVSRIEISGTQGAVREVQIFQADGDRSVMTIAPSPP